VEEKERRGIMKGEKVQDMWGNREERIERGVEKEMK
jgi:hypothetical protein